ncbi:probable LRR receptor-like serine/threonine-protein kinase At1g63430 isoform X2 [Magnolia sinica]|uniref:probable LRR receptor-like serine/threonine-protein kinase At1g63430 isoform X2 n=1 Tax=Magnolia sinica TaxID=86752 RepID=UPI00265837D5|nr:probable LRR receptor-like serine/threonine-protein kinase At1g63430 isoform X2 [Magnolia sinica]
MRSLALLQLLAAISTFLFLSCDSFTPSEVSALVAFKESIYDDPHSVLSNWNAFDEDPCDWTGIYCSPTRDHVLTLNLSSSFLKGFIARELGSLTNLQQLVLHKNNLLGPIPREIAKLASLKLLDLGMNQLSGPIPRELGYLTNVMKINLQSNELTGSIPPELGNLMKLADLRLDRNKLQGILPGSSNISANFRSDMHGMYAPHKNATGLCRLLQLRIADFSDNSFVGKIPPCLKYLPRSSFQGNCFQDRDSNLQHSNTQRCGGTTPVKSHPPSKPEKSRTADKPTGQATSKPAWLLALEIVTGTIVGLLLVYCILRAVKRCKTKSSVIIPWKKTSNGKEMTIYIDSEMLKDVVRISRQELEVACEDFSNIIGSSPDSLVYKGTMKDGPEIAVISLCISEDHWTGYLELYFQSEVADLARLNHDNTAKLLGYCKESNPFSRMLVFEYASNGTLYEHLHYGEGCNLSWIRRMKIIVGIARGLKYLHTELQPPFTVSELSSNSIYLTEDFSPKLVDFERWKTVLGKSEKNSGSMGNGGSCNGFPGSLERRHLDVQGNMFAFGVLLLEIVSGRPPYCKDGGCLLDWAKEYLELPEVISYLVDPELRYFRYDDLKVICEVANLCFQSDHPERPSMQSLTTMLENGIETDLKESPLAWAELALSS